jgi:hypothetical protein
MPTTTNITSSYAGKTAGGLFLETFKEADALKNGILTVYPNVNFKTVLRKLQTTNGRRDYSCGHVPAGSIVLNEADLEPKKVRDDWEICKEDFRKTWTEEQMGASAHNDQMSKETLDGIITDKLAQSAQEFGEIIWTGDKDNTGEFDGFLTLFSADATVIDVYIEEITESNVEAELKKALNAVPIALRNKSTLKVSVSSDIAQAYNFFLASKGIQNGLGGNANTSLVFGNYTLVVDNGLPASTIVIAEPKNLAFGTGALADHNEIKVVDEDAIGLLTGKLRGTLIYNAGVQYAYGAEIVWASNTHPVPSV